MGSVNTDYCDVLGRACTELYGLKFGNGVIMRV